MTLPYKARNGYTTGMDEILIDEKKYVSSKRAAKITGYAKDYIGQLCREGRVPARLVGRSWYVLESAIQDHRFGDSAEGAKESAESPRTLYSTWESPRYEAASVDMMPSINKLKAAGKPQTDIPASSDVNTEPPRATAVREPEAVAALEETPEIAPAVTQVIAEEGGVDIPVHTVYDLPPQDLLPSTAPKAPQTNAPHTRAHQYRLLRKASVTTVTVATLISIVVTLLGTGLLDRYVASLKTDLIISGITVYEKP